MAIGPYNYLLDLDLTMDLIWLFGKLTANFDVRGTRFDICHVDILGNLEYQRVSLA